MLFFWKHQVYYKHTILRYTRFSSIVEQFSSSSVETQPLPLEVVEKQAIVHALKVTNDNIAHAARVLNIDRTTLHRKLKKYQLLEKSNTSLAPPVQLS